MPTEAETRRRKKQDATRKRVALWLERADVRAVDRYKRAHKLPSRIAVVRALLAANKTEKRDE